MTIDDVMRAETEAERAIRHILVELQTITGRRVEWVKVEVRDDIAVTVNTQSK